MSYRTIESLETRRLLSAVLATLDPSTNTLNVLGSEVADVIRISQTSGTLVVTEKVGAVSNVVYQGLASGIGRVSVDAKGGADTILAVRGNVVPVVPMTLHGGDGQDTLQGGNGGDALFGDGDNDVLYFSGGADTYNGGAGVDAANFGVSLNSLFVSADGVADDGLVGLSIKSNVMPDVEDLIGGRGPDTLKSSPSASRTTLNGLEGDDTLIGADGVDFLIGLTGNDTLKGNGANDFLYGGDGNDTLLGGEGDDQLYGGAANDTLDGNGGQNRLWGDGGVDQLTGITGEDLLDGGGGNDVLAVTFNLSSFVRNRGRSVAGAGAYANSSTGIDKLNLKLDVGRFITDGVRPIVEKIQTVTKPLQPLVDFYERQIPVIQIFDSSQTFGKVLDSKSLLDGKLNIFVKAIKLVNGLNFDSLTGALDLGAYNVTYSGVTRLGGDPFKNSFIADLVNKLEGAGLAFPIFQDSTNAAKMVLGQNIDLVTYTLPPIGATFAEFQIAKANFQIGPVPVTAAIYGMAGFSASGTVGFDLTGIRSGNLVDGFYVSSTTSASVWIGVSATAGIGFNYDVAKASVGVFGGIKGTLTMSINDPNHDGKVRLSEFNASKPFTFSAGIGYSFGLYADWKILWWGGHAEHTIASGTFALV